MANLSAAGACDISKLPVVFIALLLVLFPLPQPLSIHSELHGYVVEIGRPEPPASRRLLGQAVALQAAQVTASRLRARVPEGVGDLLLRQDAE